MLKVGIAGVGFMGMVHYLTYEKVRGAKVVALCEQNAKRLTGDWRDIKGNFGPQGTVVNLANVATYTDLDEMIADPSIDMIDITLPPAMHADVACKALAGGKHVFSEKPMSLTPRDCQRMQRAAEKANRLLMVGHVLPYFPEYAWAVKEIASGKHGKLLGGAFRRVISDPQWLANYWVEDQVGGPMLDLHIHDAHFIRMLFGPPTEVTTVGRVHKGLPQFWHSLFSFEGGEYTVEATSGTIGQQGRSFDHGFEIHLEKATLAFEFAVVGDAGQYLCKPTIFDQRGKARFPKMADGDPMHAFKNELSDVARSHRSQEVAAALDPQLAIDAVKLCQVQSKSLLSGKKVKFK